MSSSDETAKESPVEVFRLHKTFYCSKVCFCNFKKIHTVVSSINVGRCHSSYQVFHDLFDTLGANNRTTNRNNDPSPDNNEAVTVELPVGEERLRDEPKECLQREAIVTQSLLGEEMLRDEPEECLLGRLQSNLSLRTNQTDTRILPYQENSDVPN